MTIDPNESTKNFIERVYRDIFSRIVSGDIDYDRDMNLLQRIMTSAEAVEDHKSIGGIYITMMLANYAVGRIDDALRANTLAIKAYESSSNPAVFHRAIIARNNAADLYHDLGDVQNALDISGRIIRDLSDPELYAHIQGPQFYFANRGLYHLSASQYDTAEELFRFVLTRREQTDEQYGSALANTHRGLSEVHLHAGRYDEALKAAHLCLEICNRMEDPDLLFYAYTALAHVAERDPDAATDPDTFYQLALAVASNFAVPTFRAILYLHEARWHRRFGNQALARDFADYARSTLAADHIDLSDYLLDL